jgi:hypothetical protein
MSQPPSKNKAVEELLKCGLAVLLRKTRQPVKTTLTAPCQDGASLKVLEFKKRSSAPNSIEWLKDKEGDLESVLIIARVQGENKIFAGGTGTNEEFYWMNWAATRLHEMVLTEEIYD